MKRSILLLIFSLTLLAFSAFLFTGVKSTNDTPSVQPISIAQAEEDWEVTLPDGASAVWEKNGFGNLSSNSTSPMTNLILHGTDEYVLNIQIEIYARIGAIGKILLQEDMEILPEEDVVIEIDLLPALNLHPKQYHYTTRIYGFVSFVPKERPYTRLGTHLDDRFLVLRNNGQHELVDTIYFQALYPLGVTTEEELTRLESLNALQTEPGITSDGIGPGVYRTRPLSSVGSNNNE